MSADVFKYGPYCKVPEHCGKRWALLMKPFTLTQVWVRDFSSCLISLGVGSSHLEQAEASQAAETKIRKLSLSNSLGEGDTEIIDLCVSSLQLSVYVFMTFSSSFLMAAASSDSHGVRKEAALWCLLSADLMRCSSVEQCRPSITVKGEESPEGKLEEFGSGSGILPAARLIFSDGFHEDKWTKMSKYILPVWQHIYQYLWFPLQTQRKTRICLSPCSPIPNSVLSWVGGERSYQFPSCHYFEKLGTGRSW